MPSLMSARACWVVSPPPPPDGEGWAFDCGYPVRAVDDVASITQGLKGAGRQAILALNKIDGVKRERLLAIADEFTESPCSKDPQAASYLTRIQEIRTSVKSKVIARRLELAILDVQLGMKDVEPGDPVGELQAVAAALEHGAARQRDLLWS